MLLQSKLSGAFRREVDADIREESARPWGCQLCSTVNGDVTDSPCCKTCQRLRSPPWLRLEDSDLEVAVGSRVFHTSVSGSKSVSVVVAIDYVQNIVTLLRVKAKRNEGGQQDGITFHEVVLNASQLQQQLEPLDAEHEEDCVLDDYGICGDCRGVFRVAQGDLQSRYANEDKVSELQKELMQLNEQKQRLGREKAYEKVLKYTDEVKLKTKQLQVAKRELEFLSPVFCPFCGWLPPQPAR